MPPCIGYESLSLLKAVLCFCSLLFTLYWTVQFYRFPPQSAHPLHKIIAIFLWWRVVSDGISLLLLNSCPFADGMAVILKTAGEVTFALDNTLAYFVVLLVAWGFGVSRQHLYRQEVMQLISILFFAFIAFLVCMFDPESLFLVIMIVIGVLLCVSVKITIDSMQRLEAMHAAFRDHYWIRWLPVIEEKWELFGRIYYWELIFFASQLFSFAGLHVYLQLVHETALTLYISIDIIESIIESISIFWICYLVRLQPPTHSLNIQWEETDEWDIPVYVPLPQGDFREMGDGRIPVLVVTPSEKRSNWGRKCYYLGVPASDLI